MKYDKYIRFCLGIIFCSALISCEKMDSSYSEFIQGGSRIYPGRIMEIKTSPGRNRLALSWLLPTDPKVKKVRIYWNNRMDSTELSVGSNELSQRMAVTIPDLAEGKHNFEIYTYDIEGNQSVKTEAIGEAYGSVYERSLLSREIKKTGLTINNAAFIDWQGEAESQVWDIEIRYTDISGATRTVFAPARSQVVLDDYKTLSNFEYRTRYLPSPSAIDTFVTVFQPSAPLNDVTGRYLKNYSRPFKALNAYDGVRWGTLDDWVINAAAKTRAGRGSFDNINASASFGVEKLVAADPNIVNGKMYQTVTLPPGKYEYIWSREGNPDGVNTGTNPRYIVAASGSTIPDIASIGTALTSASFVSLTKASIQFTLTETTSVSLGIIVSFTAISNNFRTEFVQLNLLPQ